MPAATRPVQIFAAMGAGRIVMGAGKLPWGKRMSPWGQVRPPWTPVTRHGSWRPAMGPVGRGFDVFEYVIDKM